MAMLQSTSLEGYRTGFQAEFAEVLERAWGFPWETLLERTLDEINRVILCKVAVFWSFDPVQNILFPKAIRGVDPSRFDHWERNCSLHLTGLAVERRRPLILPDIQIDTQERSLAQVELIKELDLHTFISIPILNRVNINQVLLVLNLFPERRTGLPSQADLKDFAWKFAAIFEAKLRSQCVKYSNGAVDRLHRSGAKSRDMAFLCKEMLELIRKSVDCESGTLFLRDPLEQNFRFVASTHEMKRGEEVWNPGEGLTGEAGFGNREIMCDGRKFKELEPLNKAIEKVDSILSVLLLPVRDLDGKAVGLLRCFNKKSGAFLEGSPFSYEDVTLVEAVLIGSYAHLQVLLAEEHRRKIFSHLSHELRVPVVAFRALLERLRSECHDKSIQFDRPHLEDLDTYAEVMRLLLKRLDLVRLIPDQLKPNAQRVHLVSDLVAPAMRHVQPFLDRYQFPHSSMSREIEGGAPLLYLDKSLMQQVLFNLYDNAIKFSVPRRERFRIETRFESVPNGFELSVSDYGIGVPSGFQDRIFGEGERGVLPDQYHITGQGLGLWLSRRIVECHGGSLTLSNLANPTTFTIFFPEQLVKGPPKLKRKGE